MSSPSPLNRLFSLRAVPSVTTAGASIFLLVVSLVIGVVAVRFPRTSTPWSFIGCWVFFGIVVLVLGAIDLVRRWLTHSAKPPRSPNLTNTVLTAVITIFVLPILFWFIWYPKLNETAVALVEDSVDEAAFPSIALFQRSDWSSQANITVNPPPKCFTGWHNETALPCSRVAPGAPCSCAHSWDNEIEERFVWGNTTYRRLSLVSTKDVVSKRPSTLMIAQAFFNYNKTKAVQDSSRASSPGLWIAVHDPQLTITQALEAGYTRMQLFNANSETAVNVGLLRRESVNGQTVYDYQLSISSVSASDLPCDVSAQGGATAACFASLIVQFPTFDRATLKTDYVIKWTDAVAEAGAWFSFFQIVGWIFSGLAVKID
ncbi:hypothetical protein QQS21_009834 [Conoideocrella luteorostrata]|uniref:Uncharacterized protein n=1 Tax=Conoideocrella luteorostrata TaxID=1105319 RepID=A0AAJ0FXF3_9HYPO|nr:hypothetical protein QQS21_009834 [Conoideocrella luteorostrata]